MNDWWKSPVLQGPENDYGEYDYMIEKLPQDYARWELSKYKWKCDNCGRESHLRFCSAHYFYCWDGYDYMNYDECWLCTLKNEICRIKYKLKKQIKRKRLIETLKLYKKTSALSFKECYNIIKRLE